MVFLLSYGTVTVQGPLAANTNTGEHKIEIAATPQTKIRNMTTPFLTLGIRFSEFREPSPTPLIGILAEKKNCQPFSREKTKKFKNI
jgi:hypothetical protein